MDLLSPAGILDDLREYQKQTSYGKQCDLESPKHLSLPSYTRKSFLIGGQDRRGRVRRI
jgi:hypothetical protein